MKNDEDATLEIFIDEQPYMILGKFEKDLLISGKTSLTDGS